MGNLRLRQVVLLTGDLTGSLAAARAAFGFTGGVRDEPGMAELGFAHEVYTFGDTFLEICAPLSADSPHGRLVAEGDLGYMAVVQVGDLAGVVGRAAEQGIEPVLHQDYGGHPISQWHPKALGTLAEIDEIDPPETWHFAPEIFEHRSTGVATDIVGAAIAVDDPTAMARRWADLLGLEAAGTRVRLGSEQLDFVETGGGRRGLRSVDVLAADPARAGDTLTLCGVDFHFVAG
ncbi:hypothetical protein [Nocardioides sp.]|uniref:hypothetical protein n=1 Tax=Nocardioides sp. TaxID=35761 RepID=UPI0039E67ACC